MRLASLFRGHLSLHHTVIQRIYLDSCATTPLGAAARGALEEALAIAWANPASQHEQGRRTRRALEALKQRLAAGLGLRRQGHRQDLLLLTSGGTESNNLALFGLAGRPPGRVIVSQIEHPSVLRAADQLRQSGFEVLEVPATPAGQICLERLEAWLQTPARLVSVMLVNHETGAIQPVWKVARMCRSAGARLHVDAVQALGKIPLSFADLEADAMTVTAHKIHGPVGIGALALRAEARLRPQLWGGFQQGGLRPGTENPTLPAGFVAALEESVSQASASAAKIESLRHRFESELAGQLDGLVVNANEGPRAPHVSNLSFPGVDRQALAMALDQAGISCSTGSACASGSSEPSAVLQAMGAPQSVVDSALRFSFDSGNTAAEVSEAARRIVDLVHRLRGAAAWQAP